MDCAYPEEEVPVSKWFESCILKDTSAQKEVWRERGEGESHFIVFPIGEL